MNTSNLNAQNPVPVVSPEHGLPQPRPTRTPYDHDFNLQEGLNRYFQIGCKTFTKHELIAYGGMHRSRVENCLRAWESRGLIRILKPLDVAEDAEISVEVLYPIDDSASTFSHPIENSRQKSDESIPAPDNTPYYHLLDYLTCGLPLGYPFETPLSQLLLLHIREHHRRDLMRQQSTLLEAAEMLLLTHPWITYLAALKHEAVLAVMPVESSKSHLTRADKEFILRCQTKCNELREAARTVLDEETRRHCERLVLLQREAYRIEEAEKNLRAARDAGFTRLEVPSPSPQAPLKPALINAAALPFLILGIVCFLAGVKIYSHSELLEWFLGFGGANPVAIALGLGGLGAMCITGAFAIYALKVKMTAVKARYDSWIQKEACFMNCRESVKFVSALPVAISKLEGYNFSALLGNFENLHEERKILETTYITPVKYQLGYPQFN